MSPHCSTKAFFRKLSTSFTQSCFIRTYNSAILSQQLLHQRLQNVDVVTMQDSQVWQSPDLFLWFCMGTFIVCMLTLLVLAMHPRLEHLVSSQAQYYSSESIKIYFASTPKVCLQSCDITYKMWRPFSKLALEENTKDLLWLITDHNK